MRTFLVMALAAIPLIVGCSKLEEIANEMEEARPKARCSAGDIPVAAAKGQATLVIEGKKFKSSVSVKDLQSPATVCASKNTDDASYRIQAQFFAGEKPSLALGGTQWSTQKSGMFPKRPLYMVGETVIDNRSYKLTVKHGDSTIKRKGDSVTLSFKLFGDVIGYDAKEKRKVIGAKCRTVTGKKRRCDKEVRQDASFKVSGKINFTLGSAPAAEPAAAPAAEPAAEPAAAPAADPAAEPAAK